MAKYKNKYRIESHRLKGWDYSANGLYYITIVTQNRECNLGYIENKEMVLSDFGAIVNNEWYKSFELRTELFLDEYVIMLNHIHAIIEIKKPETGDVETNVRSFQPPQFIRKPKSISSFVAGFKSSVNSKIDDYIDEHNLNIPKYNRRNHFFQINYHDHIIRDAQSYFNIKKYIKNNPANWKGDTFNPPK